MYTWLVLYWLIFGLLHSVLATGWCKRSFEKMLGANFRYYRFGYSVFALVSLSLVLLYHFSLPFQPAWHTPSYLRWAGGALALGGTWIMWVCIRKYFFYLSGIDIFYPGKKVPAHLETGGLHRYVRHPLYSGTLLMAWSVMVIFPYWNNLITCIMITLYTWVGAVFEERKLQQEFGEAYTRYRHRVPMLIPYKVL